MVKTPLKVVHAADCAGTPPTLYLQMDTVALGSLTVGGFDVAKTFLELGETAPPAQPPPASGSASPSPPAAAFSYGGNGYCDSYSGSCGGLCGTDGYLRKPSATSVAACQAECLASSWCEAILYPTTSSAPACTLYEGCVLASITQSWGMDFYLRLPPAPPPAPSAPPAPSGGCCRWTASGACSPAGRECTRLHEYLERKTTTHHFDDVYACLGNEPESWEMQLDGATSNITLSSGSAAVAMVPTPLKVVHAPRCHFDAPTLTLQMDTVATGTLTVGGFDVAATLQKLVGAPGRRLQQQGRPNDEAGEGESLQGSASVSALGGVSSGRQLLSSGSNRSTELRALGPSFPPQT